MKSLSGKNRRTSVDKVISQCGLSEMRNRLIKKLSKGYRQRVGLAQALVNDPEVLILDEPTVGLDPKQITDIRSLIKGLAGERTVILSTHILPEVSMTCQKVTIINEKDKFGPRLTWKGGPGCRIVFDSVRLWNCEE